MSTTEAARTILFHEPYVHVEALRRSQELPFDRWMACFHNRSEVG